MPPQALLKLPDVPAADEVDAALQGIVGVSEATCALRRRLPRLAASDCSVLVTGETGTGKENVAQALHALSPRRDGPLVSINCAALPESVLRRELFR